MIQSFRVEWDRNYGIDHRSGWSVAINGIVYVEFHRNPIAALWRAWRSYRAAQADMKVNP